ncbi:hypothetical protein E4T85_12715 [Bacillus stratosphericus]|uniref:hypothetical protein n=1 Tax=Bacillus aerius TaxID=293388 RepID=UPI0010728048|nr:hypothetical protein [Bacillus aerius]MDH6598378.1 hypothetical protein [Bacillus aerius]TFV08876.1 hypothetical protein E4T85_12715 [Bacillus stratosphericus]
MKNFLVRIMLVLLASVVFIPTTATYAAESTSKKDELVVTYNPTELQKELAIRNVPLKQQKILLQAIDTINRNDEPLASTNGPKSAGIKTAIKVLRGLANNDFAQWMLSSMFGKKAVKATVQNVNKIIKQIEHIVDTPKRAAKRANELVYAELKKHIDAGVAQGVGHVVEYIIIVGDALIL